jgi:hypothetical protein
MRVVTASHAAGQESGHAWHEHLLHLVELNGARALRLAGAYWVEVPTSIGASTGAAEEALSGDGEAVAAVAGAAR